MATKPGRICSVYFLMGACCSIFLPTASIDAADATVELEIVVRRGAPIDAAQRWTRQLSGNAFRRVRVRSGNETSPSLKTTHSQGIVIHSVVGIIDSRNRLYLPGANFQLGQKRQIDTWIKNLIAGEKSEKKRDQGSSANSAFGLSDKELVRLHDRLNIRLDVVAEQRTQEVLKQFERKTELKVTAAAVARVRLTFPVEREYAGLSAGTTLAAVLRPLSLCLVPEVKNGQTSVRIDDLRSADESWPVGWPRQKKKRDLVPKLFEHLQVEIKSTPLPTVLNAIEKKLGVPMILDHHTLNLQSIDIDRIKVRFPSRRILYDKLLGVILNNNLLKFEVRVDEAGHPFLWITKL